MISEDEKKTSIQQIEQIEKEEETERDIETFFLNV